MILDIAPRDLTAFLKNCEDCEMISDGEYVVDLFTETPPLTLNIRVSDSTVTALAAAALIYSDDEDGWYMGDRVEDANAIAEALRRAMRASE